MAPHPVQIPSSLGRSSGKVDETVALRAYEVYCHLYGPQEAMISNGCRGGFSTGELIAFLYARSFPKEEWRQRADQAWRGMDNL